MPKLGAKDMKILTAEIVHDQINEESEVALKEWCLKFKGECDRIEEFFIEKLNELIIQFVER